MDSRDGRTDVPDDAIAHAERDALRAELTALPRRQRAVLTLRYYAGLTDAETVRVRGNSGFAIDYHGGKQAGKVNYLAWHYRRMRGRRWNATP